MSEWPKRIVVYVHTDKESMWDLGLEIGLDADAIRNEFKYCGYEVGLIVEVNKDGTTTILGVENA